MKALELLFVTMRPSRWWRCLVVFVPLALYAGSFGPVAVLKALVAFAIFCLLTGAINIIDDLADKDLDKDDFLKRAFPIASSELSTNKAEFSLGIILIGAFLAAFFFGPLFGAVSISYFVAEMCYYFALKSKPVIDSLTVAVEISIIYFAGTIALGQGLSPWMTLFLISLATLVVFCERKRAANMRAPEAASPANGPYSNRSLEHFININAASSILLYCLFSVLSSPNSYLFLSVPFAVYVVLRIVLEADSKTELPLEKALVKDPTVWISLILWCAAAAVLRFIPS